MPGNIFRKELWTAVSKFARALVRENWRQMPSVNFVFDTFVAPSLLSYSVNMEVIRHYFISTTISELVHCLATMAVVFGVDVWGSLSNLVGMFLSVVTSLNNIPFQRIGRSACCLFYYESVKCSHCRQCFVLLSRLYLTLHLSVHLP